MIWGDMPRARPSRRAAALAACLALLAGCGAGGSTAEPDPATSASAGAGSGGEPEASATPTADDPAEDPALERYYGQRLAWKACNGGQCAKLRVPLDYAKPDGSTMRL